MIGILKERVLYKVHTTIRCCFFDAKNKEIRGFFFKKPLPKNRRYGIINYDILMEDKGGFAV